MFLNQYHRSTLRLGAVLLSASLLSVACKGDDSAGLDGATAGDDNSDNAQPPPPQQAQSAKSRVKFKGGQRYAGSLAMALGLPREEVCLELGTYDCVEVHNIVLGGVEPYVLRIDEPLTTAPITAPLASDRIALSACGERVQRDWSNPDNAAMFGDLAQATEPSDTQTLQLTVERLYDRLLHRAPAAHEVEGLVKLYAELEGEAEHLNRRWAQLGCFSVATTMESLFY